MNTDWYKAFFKGIAISFWNALMPDELSEAEVALIRAMTMCQPGCHLLDPGCGSGRHAIRLGQEGYLVTGIDISDEAIQQLARKAKIDNLQVKTIHDDILTVELPESYDGAYLMGNSFGYFSHQNNQAMINQVSRHLKPGARFVLHTGMLAECLLLNFEERSYAEAGGNIMLLENDYDTNQSTLISQLTFIHDGQITRSEIRHHIYTLAELLRMHEKAGLQMVEVLADTSGEPFYLGSEQAYIITEKS